MISEVALAEACRSADLDGDRRVTASDRALVQARLGEALDPALFARLPEPLPPLERRCVSDALVEKARLTLVGLDQAGDGQKLRLSGQIHPPEPYAPPEPVRNGARLGVLTHAGRELLDATLPAGAVDSSGKGWKSSRRGTSATYVDPPAQAGSTGSRSGGAAGPRRAGSRSRRLPGAATSASARASCRSRSRSRSTRRVR